MSHTLDKHAGGLPLSKRCTRRGDKGSAQGAAAAWAANAHASMCACVEVPPCSGRSAAPGDGFRMRREHLHADTAGLVEDA